MNVLAKVLLSSCLVLSSIEIADACTVLIIKDASGNAYEGRTNEFAGMLPDSLTYLPAGFAVRSVTPGGTAGMAFRTKHAILAVTLNLKLMMANGNPDMVHEGVNDQGLTFTFNAMPGSVSPKVGPDASKVLSVVDLGTWALGSFESVAQVKKALEGNQVDIWLPSVPAMGNVPAPMHFALFDKTGAGIVIEFTSGRTTVYDNPVGVMTNAPPFPWHLENLNNYAQLSNVDRNTGKFNKLEVHSPDSGNALAGVPSIQISPGRFVKAAFFSNYVQTAKTPAEAIQTLSHVMNNFDRPYGLSMDVSGTSSRAEGGASSRPSTEVTQFTVLNDLAQNHFYIRTINAINFSRFDIRKLSALKAARTVPFSRIDASTTADATDLFVR